MACCALCLPFAVLPARAQLAEAPALNVTLSPYVWIAGISGTVTTPYQRVPEQTVSADFGDLWNNISGFAFMGAAEVRYGRFGIAADLLTLAIESGFDTPASRLFAGGSGRVTATFGTVMGIYRVVQAGPHELDLGAGIRAWSLSTRLTLDPGLLAGRTLKPSTDWVDPVLGAQYTYRFGPAWAASVQGDVGGFNVGSDLTWQLMATANWRPNTWLELRGGYRHLHVERRQDGTEFAISLSGPIVAASFRF
jgi:hypothetical protein